MNTEKISTKFKVCFKNEEASSNNLIILKILKDHKLGISITEDLTKKNERLKIKELRLEANQNNENEQNEEFKWRVRGSHKSGLYFKKDTKR